MRDASASQGPTRAGGTAPRAIGIGAIAGGMYLLIAGQFSFHFEQSSFAHHILIADAMLHGQLYAREETLRARRERLRPQAEAFADFVLANRGIEVSPAQRAAMVERRLDSQCRHDWSIVDGRYYGYWGPMASAVMAPFVALFGPDVSDSAIDALFGGVNVALFYWMLRRLNARGVWSTSESCRVGLALLLAFGTVHFYLASCGRIWFAAQIVALTGLLAACICLFSAANGPGSLFLSGLFFGSAMLTRNVTAMMGLFFLIVILHRNTAVGPDRRRQMLVRVFVFLLPCIAAVMAQGAYNYARFGNVREEGLDILFRATSDPRFRADYQRYGKFSLHYLPDHLFHYFWSFALPVDDRGVRMFDPDGNSMFLVTPALLYLALAWRRRTWLTAALVAGTLPFFFTVLLFNGSGYFQFGNRFLLEVFPFLLLLAAGGMRGKLTPPGYLLIVLSIAVNLWGTYRFCEPMFEPVKWICHMGALAGGVGLALIAGVVLRRRTDFSMTGG